MALACYNRKNYVLGESWCEASLREIAFLSPRHILFFVMIFFSLGLNQAPSTEGVVGFDFRSVGSDHAANEVADSYHRDDHTHHKSDQTKSADCDDESCARHRCHLGHCHFPLALASEAALLMPATSLQLENFHSRFARSRCTPLSLLRPPAV